MPAKTNKVAKGNVWHKHADAIEKSKIKTVKELVNKLRPKAGNKPSIKGVTIAEATEMLIDIGLGTIPMGSMFKDKIRKMLMSPEEVSFKSILSSLEEISKDKDVGENLKSYLKESIESVKSGNIKDPFKENPALSEHPATAPVFRKTILDDVAEALKLIPKQKTKLKQHYGSRDHFMRSGNADIQKDTGLAVSTIIKYKETLCWERVKEVSVPLATALATESQRISDVITLDSIGLKEIIVGSGIPVPPPELTDTHLKKVIASAKGVVPELAYYNDAILSLNLPNAAESILKKKKVKSLADLRKNGLINEVIEKGKIKDEKVISALKAHARLEIVSKNFDLNKALIIDNIRSAYEISKLTAKEFKKKYKRKASEDELSHTHKAASNITAKSFPVAAWAYMYSRGLRVDSILPKSQETQSHANKILKGGSK